MKLSAHVLPRISVQQLRAFEAVARLGSVTKAASALSVSQPTVSVQLRELAESVGEALFQRGGRKLYLTEAGRALQETVAELQHCWQRFESRLADTHGLVRGQLHIATVTTAEYFVPDLLGPFAAQYPGVEIELAVENKDRVIERLNRHADDLAIMMLPPTHLNLATLPFLDNPLVVIGPASQRWSKRPMPLHKLSAQRWLMREVGSGTRQVALAHFAAHDFSPQIAMNLGSNEAIKHGVAAGLGMAVLSKLALMPLSDPNAQTLLPGLAIVPVQHFPIHRQWSVVWRRDQAQSAAARAFVRYLEARE